MSGLIQKRGFPNAKRSFIQELYIILFVVIFLENNFDLEEHDIISFISIISCYQQTWCTASSIKYPYVTFFTQICNMWVCRGRIHLEHEHCKRNGFKNSLILVKSQNPMPQFQ